MDVLIFFPSLSFSLVFKGKEKEKPKTETPSIPSTPQMQPPNKQTSPLPTPNTGNNPPRMNKKSDSMSFAPANQGQSNQNMFAGLIFKFFGHFLI